MTDIVSFIRENEIPITVVPEERHYWLVRTQGGDFYDEFYFDNFIAIGWNEISNLEQLAQYSKDEMIDIIDRTYKSKDEEEKDPQPGRIYGQIYRFLFEINMGDIVMCPTHNSTHISFGIVTSNAYLATVNESELDEGVCPYIKRRDVKWMKTVPRTKLDPYLYRMMQSHHTISNAYAYAHFIDRTLHSFFVKGNKAYLVLNVEKQGVIPALDLVESVNSVIDLVPMIENTSDPEKEFSRRDVDLKMNVQSPGIMEFSSHIPEIIMSLGMILMILVGGTFKFTVNKQGANLEGKTDGLLEKMLKFIKHRDQQKLLQSQNEHRQALEAIEAKIPEELKMHLQRGDAEDAKG